MTDCDVAIVGLGPVGAFSGLLLAEAGLRVVILERSPDPVVLPRAVGLDGESVRAFQRIGLGDEIAALLQPPRERDPVCLTDSKHEELFGLELPTTGHNGWRDIAFFDQPELEAKLRDLVGAHERVDARLGREVVSVAQDGQQVTLRYTGGPGGGESSCARPSCSAATGRRASCAAPSASSGRAWATTRAGW